MKKIFTLCFALFSAVTMFAQETKGMFEFATADGTVVPSGTVITKSDVEDFTEPEDEYDTKQISTGLFVKPIKTDLNGEKICVKLRLNVERIDNGSIAFCLLLNCKNASEKGEFESNGGFVDKLDDLATEWMIGYDEETGKLFCKCVEEIFNNTLGGKDHFWDDVLCHFYAKESNIYVRKCSFSDTIEIDSFDELCEVDESYKTKN